MNEEVQQFVVCLLYQVIDNLNRLVLFLLYFISLLVIINRIFLLCETFQAVCNQSQKRCDFDAAKENFLPLVTCSNFDRNERLDRVKIAVLDAKSLSRFKYITGEV